MESLIIEKSDKKTSNFILFSNKDGKEWAISKNSIKKGLEIYEPSGIKGKLIKKFLNISWKNQKIVRILNEKFVNIDINEELKNILNKRFGYEWNFSVFFGTPCVDKKITIQIYNKDKILGYCKIGNSNRVGNLFNYENKILRYLEEKNVENVPKSLGVFELKNKDFIFLQDTKKKFNSKTKHQYCKIHENFLNELYEKTNNNVLFEKTEYCYYLQLLKNNLNLVDKKYFKDLNEIIDYIFKFYDNKNVKWGVVHGDFTPWNTCLYLNNVYAFDFEYGLLSAPKDIDYWHFWFQTEIFENKSNIDRIKEKYITYENRNDFSFILYLLYNISLYLNRNDKNDIKSINEKINLLIYIWKNGDVNEKSI